MSKVILETAETNEADSSDLPSEEQLKDTIRQLVRLWKPQHKKELTVRYQTGRKLNELIGPPTGRQDYGGAVLERVSEQIGVSRSELSRMRKFANAHPELEKFYRDNPKCTSWTKVKEHLATIDANGQPVSKDAKATSPVKGVCRSIKSLIKKVTGIEPGSAEDRQQMMTAFRHLAQAVSDAFGVTVQVEAEQDSVSTTDDSQKGPSQAA